MSKPKNKESQEPSQKPTDRGPQPEAQSTERTYFESRIYDDLGVTPEYNLIKLKVEDPDKGPFREVENKIFTEDADGNILITPFDLDRYLIEYDNRKATPTRPNINNNRRQTFQVTRFKVPRTYKDPKTGKEKTAKYDFPKGAFTKPFFPKNLLQKWESGEAIETLVMTEGYFKATSGDINGLYIVGLSSITHLKEKDTQAMYTDVIRIITGRKVKNVIVLYDGDAPNISTKDLQERNDLRRRPLGFINSAKTVRELLKDYSVEIYFACINSRELEGQPKGLDDLYAAFPTEKDRITADLLAFSHPSPYFTKHNITFDPGKLYKWFSLDTVENFYAFHAEIIQQREFIYNGTTYRYNPNNGECEVKIPGEASNYFRVGDDYYKFVLIPNKYQQNEKKFVRRLKTTIVEDHNKAFLNHIPKYEAFCNVPDHVNYQQVFNNCFNVYAPFEHEAEEGECDTILNFVKHIFRDQYEFGLDYLQLLYQMPTQTLPILCLVSKENKTGKSTFIKLVKAIFGQNATVVGNEDLANQFNGFWSTKLVVAVEETFVDKKSTTERIKALATADKINMNRKSRDQEEIDFFAKFILASNNEDSFIYASAEDIRYWVLKIPRFEGKEDVRMLQTMIDEIPAFLYFLMKRKMFTKNESRMWFNEDLLVTEALQKLQRNSRSGIEKEIYEYLKTIYIEFGDPVVYLTPKNVMDLIFHRKMEVNYLTKIFRENMKVELANDGKVMSYKIPYWGDIAGEIKRQENTYKGRPWEFEAEKILSAYDLNIYRKMHQTEQPEVRSQKSEAQSPKPQAHQITLHEEIKRVESEPKPDEDLPF